MEISKVSLSSDEIEYLEEQEKTAPAKSAEEKVSIHEEPSKKPAATDPISIHGDRSAAPAEDSLKIAKKKEEAKTEEKKEEKSWWQRTKEFFLGSSKKPAATETEKPKTEEKQTEKGFWSNLKDILFGNNTKAETTGISSDKSVSNDLAVKPAVDLNEISQLKNKEISSELAAKIKASDSLTDEQKVELRKEIIAEMTEMGINVNELTEEKFDAFVKIMQFQNLDHKTVKGRRADLRTEVTRQNYKRFIAKNPNLTEEQKKQLERQFSIDGALEKVALRRATLHCTNEEAAEVYLQASKDTEELRKASIEALAEEMQKDKISDEMREIFVTSSEKTSEVVLDSVEVFAKSDRCPESFKQKLLNSIAETRAAIKANSSALVQTLRERAEEDKIHYAEELRKITIKKEQQQEERKISKTNLENAKWKIWLVARKIYAFISEMTKKMGQSYVLKDEDLKALAPELFAERQNALSSKELAYWEDYDIASSGRLLDNDFEIAAINFFSAATTSAIFS
ncbi:MAG: hypothetical protein PHX18_01700 [Candidatus Gastranaerophilales bacterium]|nr:hypothetical protein [Candidatus Gastranaerophilales bacterium]